METFTEPSAGRFLHSAFTFGHEARINKSTVGGNRVPFDALVKLVQKRIQYLELETNLSNVRQTF
ncbi:hypothetical protein H5410_063207 [Solanum commersonii]|uniref:Uncharacterized protein n=1 Tax=Solanum commersonii TaxID=4109 RepID=A0A9J5WCM9_SOLCO|nr:hypothetical protein H5410_063207 [Solanum commersonii]